MQTVKILLDIFIFFIMLTRVNNFLNTFLANDFWNDFLIFFTFCCKVDKEDHAYLSGN